MAEILTASRSEVARQAGQKAHPTALNNARGCVIDTPAIYASLNIGDTVATDLVIPAGSRLLAGATLSCAAGNASSTISVGIRDSTTKAVIDATAIIAATSIAAAATAQFNTGTKVINGQYYIVPQDSEVYLTVGGAATLANQPIRVELSFVSP